MPPLALALLLALAPAPPDTAADAAPPDTARARRGVPLALGLTVGAGVEVPFHHRDPATYGYGRVDPGPTGTNAALRLTLTGHALRRLSASVTFYRYVRPHLQAPWDPDFIYAVGYDPGGPRAVTLSYANYDANRLAPRAGAAVSRLDRGVLTATYRVPAPAALQRLVRLDRSAALGGRLSYELMPSYYDAASNGYRGGKHRLGLAVSYYAFRGAFVDLTLHAYPARGQQQPWDPDFTYAVGYARGYPTTLTLHYANYSGTRLPGRARGEQTGRLRDGRLYLTWSHRF